METRAKGILLVYGLLSGCGGGGTTGEEPTSAPALAIDSFDPAGGLSVHLTVDDETILVESRVLGAADAQTRVITIRGANGALYAERDVDLASTHVSGSYDGHSFGNPGDADTEADAELWSGIENSHAGRAAIAVSFASADAALSRADAKETLNQVSVVSDALDDMAAGRSITPENPTSTGARVDPSLVNATAYCAGLTYFEKTNNVGCTLTSGPPQNNQGGATVNCLQDPFSFPTPLPDEVQACLQQLVTGGWKTLNWTCQTKYGVGYTPVFTKSVPYFTKGRWYRSWMWGKNRVDGTTGVCYGPSRQG